MFVMPSALWMLIGLRIRAAVRRSFRGIRSIRGAAVCLLGIAMLILWFGPMIWAGFTAPRSDAMALRAVAPVAILTLCFMNLLSAGPESGIAFRAGEVDFLFPAPFTRRQLLMYKLAGTVMSTLFLALFMSVFLLQSAALWSAVYAGAFLSLLFVQLVHMAIVLISATVAERAYTRGRKLVMIVVGAAAAIGAARVAADSGAGEGGFIGAIMRFRDTPIGAVIVAPFEVFGRTLSAQHLFPDLLGWGAAALAIDAALILFILRLDANFLESSAAVSEKLYERLQKVRRGNAAWSTGKVSNPRRQLSMLPWLGGAGPIAWRQINSALRGARGIVVMLIIFSITFGFSVIRRGSESSSADPIVFALIGMSIFVLPQMLTFDFRSDVDRMDVLKSLPIRPVSVVIGQLLTPVAVASLLQWLVIAAIGALRDEWPPLLVAVAFLLLPFNVILFEIENLVFLNYPHRQTGAGLGDVQAFGRQMLTVFVKVLVLSLASGVAGGTGGLIYALTGKSAPLALIGTWLAAALVAVVLLGMVTTAYRRFDPSTQTPA